MTLIATLDIGKTHSRLAVTDLAEGHEVSSVRRANRIIDSALGGQLDLAGIEQWLISQFSQLSVRDRISAIVPIAHGAAAVLLDEHEKVLAALDYENERIESVSAEYQAERDTFEATYSPPLPLGLNLGRQLFYLEKNAPELFARARHILLYPQYWAWRLSGLMASEVTSLGCHSDLWQPRGSFSALALRRGWATRLPNRRFAGEVLGPAVGPLAQSAELPIGCRVVCGVHDSNASYLRHLLGRRDQPFAVVSSGTWTVVMAHRSPLTALKAERDMLANVDVFGTPTPTARFMGGREYEAIAQGTAQPSLAAVRSIVDKGAMAVPSFAAAGPFSQRAGTLINAGALGDEERAGLATLYLALMTELAIEWLGATGDVIVDGPLALNPLFASVLSAVLETRRIWVDEGRCATQALRYLAGLPEHEQQPLKAPPDVQIAGLMDYRRTWREALD